MPNPFVLERDTLSEKIQIRLTPAMHAWLEEEAQRREDAGQEYGTNVTDLVRFCCARFAGLSQRDRDKGLVE